MRRPQKRLLRFLPVGDDVAIFLFQECIMALSTRVSDLGSSGYSMPGSLIVPRTVLDENMILACSRLLDVIRSGDLSLRCFRVMRTMELDDCTQLQNLSSR